MRCSHRVGLVVSALTLVAGIAAPAASAAAHSDSTPQAVSTDINIEGTYYWNADGFTGTLRIARVAADGSVDAILNDSGLNEHLTGTWKPSTTTLDLQRPLPDGVTQFYEYYLGGSRYSAHPTMFGGLYTTVPPATIAHGTYLDSAMPQAASMQRPASPGADTDVEGTYYWNADGFTGALDIYDEVNGTFAAVLNVNGQGEFLHGTRDFAHNSIWLSRPLPDGTVQTYEYLLGGSPYSQYPKMFGGYFRTSPGGISYGSYLDSAR
ncbi:MAG TPA: hypothetical protein VGM75_33195 [Pseudonocardiaceae bacterium]